MTQRRRLTCTIEPMTLGNMRSFGIRSLAVTCFGCNHSTTINVDGYPDSMPVPDFGTRVMCTRCGTDDADVRPNWREKPERNCSTGTQWRN